MNWLLITTATRTPERLDSNIGDEFARMGVQRLILRADPAATFDLLDKESAADWDRPRSFDRAVICGMPLFWSNEKQTSQDIFWWPYVWDSDVAHEKRKLMAMGVGHVLIDAPVDPARYAAGIAEVTKKAWCVITREPIFGQDPSWYQSICPSVFCMRGRPVERKFRLCNLMPGGGHFGYLVPGGTLWEEKQAPDVAKALLDAGFVFVAHVEQEIDYAKKLGWPDESIAFFVTAEEYLALYAQADFYFGNRLHGAVVCAATGAPVWAVTHDSRLGMVLRLGGIATPPFGITGKLLTEWILLPKRPSVAAEKFQPEARWEKMSEIMAAFARPIQPAKVAA